MAPVLAGRPPAVGVLSAGVHVGTLAAVESPKTLGEMRRSEGREVQMSHSGDQSSDQRKGARGYRVGLVGSSGGHLAQLMALEPFWARHDRFWVTFDTPDAVSLLAGERVYWCHHPTNRHLPNLVRNTALAARVMAAERPDLILSTGAGAAIPYFWLAPLARSRSVFIEVIDRVDGPTLTARLVRPVATELLVQWPEQQAFFPRSRLVGPLL
jgi:hypothetical protein